MGDIFTSLPDPKPFIINIDHHITNTYFGDLNWVADCPSTAEMIYSLYTDMRWEINAFVCSELILRAELILADLDLVAPVLQADEQAFALIDRAA